jgi:ankyrin repeat protein
LSRAAEKGDEAVVQLLLKYGAQPNLKDKAGHTPLLRAMERESAEIVQLPLSKGVEVDCTHMIVSESNYICMDQY